MAVYNGNPYGSFSNVNAKKGIFRFGTNLSAQPSTASEYLLYVSGGSLTFWDGSSETTLGSAGGLVNFSLNDAYDDGSTITADEGAVTIAASSVTTAALSITMTGSDTTPAILLANSGTGNDITGTSSTWSVTAAGAATFIGVTLGDNELITMGDGSDATIGWNGTVLNVAGATDFDNNVTLAASATITQTGVAGSTVLTITAGDMVMSDGSVAITDADNAETVTVINNTATTIGAAASAGVIQIESTSLTTGAAVNVQLTEGTLNGGYYYSAWDATGAARVFSVGEDGATTLAGNAAGTDVLTLTTGDLFLSDTDGSVFESENGTTTLLTLDNKAGIIAADSAVVLVDAGGAVASGGNALRVIFSGTADAGAILAEFLPDAGSVGIKVEGGGVATQEAFYVDADPTATSVGYMHSDAVIAADKAVLELHTAGAIANGSALLRVDMDGTPAATAYGIEVDLTGVTATNDPGAIWVNGVGKDVRGVVVDVDNTDVDGVLIDGSGALTGGRALKVDNDGIPTANTDAVAEFTFTGTATNNPIVVSINNSTVNAAPLLVNSNVATATRSVGTFIQDSTTGTIEVITLRQDDVSEEFIAFNSTAGSGNAVDLTNTTPAGILGSVLVTAVDGTAYRLALYAAAGWGA